eukprot:GFYU01005422.1.p1 GENE.GFYU01005422.1~~GFYU01005422.1.p1  ORF type:complete len:332 (-),score=43.50 GFYU01005422.1:297-1292(-)
MRYLTLASASLASIRRSVVSTRVTSRPLGSTSVLAPVFESCQPAAASLSIDYGSAVDGIPGSHRAFSSWTRKITSSSWTRRSVAKRQPKEDEGKVLKGRQVEKGITDRIVETPRAIVDGVSSGVSATAAKTYSMGAAAVDTASSATRKTGKYIGKGIDATAGAAATVVKATADGATRTTKFVGKGIGATAGAAATVVKATADGATRTTKFVGKGVGAAVGGVTEFAVDQAENLVGDVRDVALRKSVGQSYAVLEAAIAEAKSRPRLSEQALDISTTISVGLVTFSVSTKVEVPELPQEESETEEGGVKKPATRENDSTGAHGGSATGPDWM